MSSQKLNIFKNSNKWKYILITVIFAFLISGGILGFQWWMSKEEIKLPPPPEIPEIRELPPPPEIKEEIKLPPPPEIKPEIKEERIKEEKVLEVSVSECENIAQEKDVARTLCFINLGKESKDISLCNQIGDIREKGYCYGGVAGVKKDLTVCLEFQNTAIGIWYEKLITESHTPAELSWTSSRNIPLDLDATRFSEFAFNPPIIGNGIALAFEIMVSFGTPCYIGAAFIQEDLKVCDQAEGWEELFPHYLFLCQTRTGILLAVTKKKPEICDETVSAMEHLIERERLEEGFLPLCYGLVGAEIKEVNLCNKITDDEDKTPCFSYIARTLKDPEICERLSLAPRDYCFFGVARVIPELNICNRIERWHIRDDCYVLLAGILYSEKICEKRAELLTEKDTKCEEHFKSRLKLVKDPSICEGLRNEENKKNCYFYSAVNSKNREICKKIIDSQLQEDCYAKLVKILR